MVGLFAWGEDLYNALAHREISAGMADLHLNFG